MDKTDAINIAIIYANAVKEKYQNVQLILFGSYAKGNYNEDSDIDIAVIFKDYANVLDIQLELMRIRRSIDSRIEPHPFRARDFKSTNPIVNEIMLHGKKIKTSVA